MAEVFGDLDPGEVESAGRDEARPGVWIQLGQAYRGDGHLFNQDETDKLIARELLVRLRQRANAEPTAANTERLRLVEGMVLDAVTEVEVYRCGDVLYAVEQRGGVHRNELVRMEAVREWGNLDRNWGAIVPNTADGPGTLLYRDPQGGVVTFPWMPGDEPLGTAVEIHMRSVRYANLVTNELEERAYGMGMPSLVEIIRRSLDQDLRCRCTRCPFSGGLARTSRCSLDELRAHGVPRLARWPSD